jgi:hypothetical protein
MLGLPREIGSASSFLGSKAGITPLSCLLVEVIVKDEKEKSMSENYRTLKPQESNALSRVYEMALRQSSEKLCRGRDLNPQSLAGTRF